MHFLFLFIFIITFLLVCSIYFVYDIIININIAKISLLQTVVSFRTLSIGA